MTKTFVFSLGVLLAFTAFAIAADPVFSGPQVGEKLPPLKMKGVFGEHAAKEFELIELAGERPVFVVFVHARTRPAFGLTNAMMRYAATRKKDGLTSGVVFLTPDSTSTEKWMNVVQKHFPKNIEWGISPDGQEGPGAYGLNRNVTLTILVGKEGKVTENFALVQPSMQADGPKILKAIVAAVGSGEVPDINSLSGPRYQGRQDERTKAADDPKLIPLIRAVINKQATPEEIDVAAKKLEEYVQTSELAAKHLGRVTNTVVNSDKLSNYGTPTAQEYLKKWAKKYPSPTATKTLKKTTREKE